MFSVLVNAFYSLYCNLDLYTLIWSAIGVSHFCFLPSECVHKISHFLLIPLVADSFVGVAGLMQNFLVGKSVYFCEFSEQNNFDSSIMSFLLTFVSIKGDNFDSSSTGLLSRFPIHLGSRQWRKTLYLASSRNLT